MIPGSLVAWLFLFLFQKVEFTKPLASFCSRLSGDQDRPFLSFPYDNRFHWNFKWLFPQNAQTNKSFIFPRYLTSSWMDSRRLADPVLMDRLKITWADFTLGVSSLKTEWLVALLFWGCPEQPPYGVPHLQLGRKQHSLAALTQLAG